MTLITLRLPTELRICQVTIIIYTRGLFSILAQPRPDRAYPRWVIIRARGITAGLYTTHHDAPVLYIRKSSHRTGTRAREKPIRWSSEGDEGADWLNNVLIVLPRRARAHPPKGLSLYAR